MTIAIDYDRTADDARLHDLIRKMRSGRNEVWICTMRKDNEFNRGVLSPVLKKLELNFSTVIFCNEKPKEEMLQMINADIYIDNVSDEFESIINHTNTIPLLWLGQ